MNGGSGVQLTGSKPASLTLDHVSFNTRFGSTINSSPLNAFELSVTNSRLSAHESAIKVRNRGNLRIRITNSTLNSVRDKAVDAGGDVTRATVAAENSIFTGQVQIDHFTSNLRHLVCFPHCFL